LDCYDTCLAYSFLSLPMEKPIELAPARRAAQRAITELENGDKDAASRRLERVMSENPPPASGRPDTRPIATVLVLANIERALREIENHPDLAIRTLQLSLQSPRHK
jgi:hypothetical protein